jgi:hypothetical protein
MLDCTLSNDIQIAEGTFDDYKELAKYHYRNVKIGPFTNIFVLKPRQKSYLNASIIGVIVYSMPNPNLELRNIATDNFFTGLVRKTQLALINKSIRRISRLVIDPRFRGLGLATRLVHETMPLVNVPIIEASAVMSTVNPFFEKAGMTAYTSSQKTSSIRLKEALNIIGIDESLFIDPLTVHQKIEFLTLKKRNFIEREFHIFLKSFGNKRYTSHSIEQTRFILSRLTERPVYYIWFNQSLVVNR